MITNSLAEQMLLWGLLKLHLTDLEEEIKARILDLKETREAGKVRAVYSDGRGSTDYGAIGVALNEAGTLTAEMIAKHTSVETVTDWKAAAEEVGIPQELAEKFYTAGKPTASLKLVIK